MTGQRFTAPLEETSIGGGGHWVVVPADVVAALGGKGRIKINATINGVPYRGSVARYSGKMVLGILKSIVEETGVAIGDPIQVFMEIDEQPREVEVPDDLAAALSDDPTAATAWGMLSYTRRKELANGISGAKREETRARRLARALKELKAGS